MKEPDEFTAWWDGQGGAAFVYVPPRMKALLAWKARDAEIEQAIRAERERCVAECDALAQKWFAEERHSWGTAAGECAARLEADDAD